MSRVKLFENKYMGDPTATAEDNLRLPPYDDITQRADDNTATPLDPPRSCTALALSIYSSVGKDYFRYRHPTLAANIWRCELAAEEAYGRTQAR